MPQMRLVPEMLDREEVIDILDDLVTRYRSGDCLEAQFTIQLDPDSDKVMMAARYRVGAVEGVEAMVVVGSMLELPDA